MDKDINLSCELQLNKDINSSCICKTLLNYYNEELFIMLPCEHHIHYRCIKKIKNNKCPFCQLDIKNLLSYKKIKSLIKQIKGGQDNISISISRQDKALFYQRYVDMSANKYCGNHGNINLLGIFFNLIPLTFNLMDIALINSKEDVKCISKKILEMCNIEIKIVGKKNLLKGKKIIASTHQSIYDPLIIYDCFDCGFMGSYISKDVWFVRQIMNYLPLLLINRGLKSDNVDKIMKYIENIGSLCIFPEGRIRHPKVLMKFRSGAFRTGYPVQPIILKYEPYIYSNSYSEFFAKALSHNKSTVTVTILKPHYPPFSNEKIEYIRHEIAKVGNLALSRVSNRDIKD